MIYDQFNNAAFDQSQARSCQNVRRATYGATRANLADVRTGGTGRMASQAVHLDSWSNPASRRLPISFVGRSQLRRSVPLHAVFRLSVEGLLAARSRALMRTHLALCEARDINDEMERRLANR